MLLDRFLEGAFDLHCHVYPEMTLEHEARQDDVSLLAGMQAAGMGGVVLKSHFWPTVDRCYYLGRICGHGTGAGRPSSSWTRPLASGADPGAIAFGSAVLDPSRARAQDPLPTDTPARVRGAAQAGSHDRARRPD
jgi:hypothetical protein